PLPGSSEEAPESRPVSLQPAMQQPTSTPSLEAGTALEHQIEHSLGQGSPLPDHIRGFMEPRFGVDFSGVRTHTGSVAMQMNNALHAQAFTVQQDIFFGSGHAPSDLHLTAHELTHVVQQTGGKPPALHHACASCAAREPSSSQDAREGQLSSLS